MSVDLSKLIARVRAARTVRPRTDEGRLFMGCNKPISKTWRRIGDRRSIQRGRSTMRAR